MDVNFTSSSGTQTPLANIVSSGDGYIKFSDGSAIAYGCMRTNEELIFSQGSSETYYAVSNKAYKKIQYPPAIDGIFTKINLYMFSIQSYYDTEYTFGHSTRYLPPCSVKFENAMRDSNGIEISNYCTYDKLIVIDFKRDFYALLASFQINYLIIGRWK